MALKRWLKTAKLRDESEPACKRQKLESFEGYTADPEIIITWNCNSLVKRAENNAAYIAQFVRNTSPDIICLQEVCHFALSRMGKLAGNDSIRSWLAGTHVQQRFK
jgi:hypothetical protein